MLCYGITPTTTSSCRRHARDLETCAEYLHERRDHLRARASVLRRRGAAEPRATAAGSRELFGVWETRNGSRARELNMPAAVYIETHGGTGIGGSDDHAGVDIGRTFTETPAALGSPEEFLRHVREGRATGARRPGQRREVGALGARARDPGLIRRARRSTPDASEVERSIPRRCWRSPSGSSSTAPSAAASRARDLGADGGAGGPARLARQRRPRRRPARADRDRCRPTTSATPTSPAARAAPTSGAARGGRRGRDRRGGAASGYAEAARSLFERLRPGDPLRAGDDDPRHARWRSSPRRDGRARDGWRWSSTAPARCTASPHTIERIREHGVPGWEVEVIGTDPRVDRRLPAVGRGRDAVLRRDVDRASRACPSWSRRWSTAATT